MSSKLPKKRETQKYVALIDAGFTADEISQLESEVGPQALALMDEYAAQIGKFAIALSAAKSDLKYAKQKYQETPEYQDYQCLNQDVHAIEKMIVTSTFKYMGLSEIPLRRLRKGEPMYKKLLRFFVRISPGTQNLLPGAMGEQEVGS